MFLQLKKELQEVTAKLGQQMAQESKEGNNSDGSGKEEDTSNSLPGSAQVFHFVVDPFSE